MLSFYYSFFSRTGFHFGGLKSKDKDINFQNYPVFLGKRSNLMIIDLKHTFYSLRISLFFLIKIITLRGKILGIETREFLCSFFMFFFSKVRQSFFYKKWLSGFLTNFRYFKRFAKLIESKKVTNKLIEEYEGYFLGVKNLRRPPTFIIFNETNENLVAHSEAARLAIPNVSFYDFFDNTSGITFPVPGSVSNDDSVYFLSRLFYGSVLIGNYKEIYFFFRKNLYFTKLNREKFLNNSSFYKLQYDGGRGLKKNFLKKVYRSKLKLRGAGVKKKYKKRRLKKATLRKKFIKIILGKKNLFRRAYKKCFKFKHLKRKYFIFAKTTAKIKYFRTRQTIISRLVKYSRKLRLKNFNFLTLKYFNVKKEIFSGRLLQKKFKIIKLKKRFKILKNLKSSFFLEKFSLTLKKIRSGSFHLISLYFKKYLLKYKKIFFAFSPSFILKTRKKASGVFKIKMKWQTRKLLKLKKKKLILNLRRKRFLRSKQRKLLKKTLWKGRFIKFLSRRIEKFRRRKKRKFFKFRIRFRRRRRQRKLKRRALLRYLSQFFIFRRCVVLRSNASFMRSAVAFKSFEAFAPRRLSKFLLKKYFLKKKLFLSFKKKASQSKKFFFKKIFKKKVKSKKIIKNHPKLLIPIKTIY